jgi:hypothetical protein
MKVAVVLLSAPVGYLLLTGWLLAKTRPVPVTALSSVYAQEERELEAAA